jgi:hypothetical protein
MMMFIPKPAKAKAIYPINLPFFMLKMIKKMVNRHIRDEVLKFYPSHWNQFACQLGHVH